MDVPNNALKLFDDYKNYYQKNETPVRFVSKTKVALIRCIVPALGGPKPKGKYSTQDDLKAAMVFLQGISLEQILNAAESVRTFIEEEDIPTYRQREHWTYLNKLIKWASEQEHISNHLKDINNPSNTSSFSKVEIPVKGKSISLSGKQIPQKYALGSRYGDYITFALHKQLEDYRNFLIEERGLSDICNSTVDANLGTVNLLLGWLHKQKNVPLDSLSLESIVPLLKTKPNRADFKDFNGVFNNKAYLDNKKTLEKQAKESREQTILLVKSCLEEHSKAVSRKLSILATIINVAKFVYKNETNNKIAKNFEDIEIIELLRKVRRDELNNAKGVRLSRAAHIISWEKVFKILACVRKEADTEFNTTSKTMNKPRKKDGIFPTYKLKYKRSDYGVANNLQTFLIIAFIVLLTPDRWQSIQNMHIGITLRKGIIAKGEFIAQEDMNKQEYEPSQAMWYQYTGDHKTINFYSDCWGRVPNFNFGDKTLYYYIDQWLEKYRIILLKDKKECKHLFVDIKTGKEMNTKRLWNLVRERSRHFVGISVTPQTLLRSYTTHLETVAASPEVKKVAAEWMKCEDETAENFYPRVNAFKIEAVLEYNEQMVKDYFSGIASPLHKH